LEGLLRARPPVIADFLGKRILQSKLLLSQLLHGQPPRLQQTFNRSPNEERRLRANDVRVPYLAVDPVGQSRQVPSRLDAKQPKLPLHLVNKPQVDRALTGVSRWLLMSYLSQVTIMLEFRATSAFRDC